jgi:hypothetical protein
MIKSVLLIVVASFLGMYLQAQEIDSMVVEESAQLQKNNNDSLHKPTYTKGLVLDGSVPYLKLRPNPKRAGLWSSIIPGAGQVYNMQYWKVPVVYGLLGGGLYMVVDNHQKYQRYRKAYVQRIDGDPNTVDEFVDLYRQASSLKTKQDEYRQSYDMFSVLTVLVYGLQIMDALAYAYLQDFDIDPNITYHVSPVPTPYGMNIGVAVKYTFPTYKNKFK